MSHRIPARNVAGDQILRGTQVSGEDVPHFLLVDSSGNAIDVAATDPSFTARGLVTRPIPEREPTFMVSTAISAFAASRFHLVILNTGTAVLKLMRLVVQPTPTVVTGALSGPWTLRRREGYTTAPAGGNALTPSSHDSVDALPAGISVFNAPTTAPAGGTVRGFGEIVPQPDEIKVTTLDAPTFSSILDGGGTAVYDARFGGDQAKAIRLRQNQTIELQQDGTAGTGNARVFAVFTTV